MGTLIEEEYETYNQDRLWKTVFDRLRNQASLIHTHSFKEARLPENRDRNRYRDVNPYDDFRVKLEDSENDYINASLVKVPLARRMYILTQGPLANTSGHFWLMVWQQNTKGVLMLNKVIEDRRPKCHQYYPTGSEFDGEDSIFYPDVGINVVFMEQEDFGFFIKRTLKIVDVKTSEEKTVLQFHYVAWPDFGIPRNSESFLSFLYAVRQSGIIPTGDDDYGPPVIHCSAGIGRSGTFCLVDSALVLVERTKSLASLDIRSMLLDMRQYRSGLIQTAEQLQFSYMAILDGARVLLSHNSINESADDDVCQSDDSRSSTADEPGDELNGEGPEPPVRSSSLENGYHADDKKDVDATPIKPVIKREHLIPEPPKRTSSLHKAASLDQPPPPVPPRPPHNLKMNRQNSAPAVPDPAVSGSVPGQELNEEEEEEEEGYINIPPSKLKRKRQEREEKNKKTKEMVEQMKAKQKAAEEQKNRHSYFSSPVLWAGAVIVVLVAVGVMYYNGTS